MTIKELASRLKYRREFLGIKQTELALMIDATQKQIWQWESGKTIPRADSLLRLANALETTPNYLLGLTINPERGTVGDGLTDREIQLLEIFRRLPDRQRELLDIASVLSGPDDLK